LSILRSTKCTNYNFTWTWDRHFTDAWFTL